MTSCHYNVINYDGMHGHVCAIGLWQDRWFILWKFDFFYKKKFGETSKFSLHIRLQNLLFGATRVYILNVEFVSRLKPVNLHYHHISTLPSYIYTTIIYLNYHHISTFVSFKDIPHDILYFVFFLSKADIFSINKSSVLISLC